MKIKQKPEDFIVEEVTGIKPKTKKDKYKIYKMEKTGLDTFEALSIISKKTNIPLRQIGFAGLKDKHAVTRQYVSVPAEYNLDIKNTKNLSLCFQGYNDKKIVTGDLKGNFFMVTVRDITQKKLEKVKENIETVKNLGVPNYYDSQRFGSVIKKQFIFKYILQKNYEKAVKIFLTSYTKNESRFMKEEKRKILANWHQLRNIKVKNWVFKKIIDEYLKTGSWLRAYRKTPVMIREIHKNAYQSYIWNECLKETLKTCVDNRKLFPIKYKPGFLLFYKNLSSRELKTLPVFLKTLSHRVILNDEQKMIVNKVLSKEGILLSDLDVKKNTGVYFKTVNRHVIIKPRGFIVSNPEKDELNSSKNSARYKVEFSFSLPKGSYATMVTKGVFYK